MENEKSFSDSFKLPIFSLMVSGVQTNTVQNSVFNLFIERYLIYFEMLWLHTDIAAEIFWIIDGILQGKSLIQLCLIAPCTIISILSTVKITFLYKGKSVLINVLNKMKEIQPKFEKDEFGDTETDAVDVKLRMIEEKKIVEDSMKLLKFVTRALLFVSYFVFSSFSGLPAISMSIEYIETGNTSLKLPFLVNYFFDPFKITIWPFVYLHQVLSTLIVSFGLFASESVYFALCTYLTMNFRLLCHKLEHIVFSHDDPKLKRRIDKVVKRHQELIQLNKDIEYLYSRPTLIHILASSVLICLSGFNIVFSSDIEAIIAYVTFLVLSLTQTLLLCYFGDMIMHSSSKVTEAVYKSRWYIADQESKKTLLLIIIRAQKTSKLTAANFADLNLSAFTTILSRSWSYFALLKTMYK